MYKSHEIQAVSYTHLDVYKRQVLTRHIDTKGVLGIDKVFPARFLIPLQERCPELKTVWGSDCVDRCV